MPWDPKVSLAVNATDQIILSWRETAELLSAYKYADLVAEKKRASMAFKEFFMLSYPALKSKRRVEEWEEWFKTVDFDNLAPLDIQLAFINYCTELIKYKILPLSLRKPLPRGGIALEHLEEEEETEND